MFSGGRKRVLWEPMGLTNISNPYVKHNLIKKQNNTEADNTGAAAQRCSLK